MPRQFFCSDYTATAPLNSHCSTQKFIITRKVSNWRFLITLSAVADCSPCQFVCQQLIDRRLSPCAFYLLLEIYSFQFPEPSPTCVTIFLFLAYNKNVIGSRQTLYLTSHFDFFLRTHFLAFPLQVVCDIRHNFIAYVTSFSNYRISFVKHHILYIFDQ